MLSSRIANLRGSPVRAMLAAAQQPDVISFAGGLPSPESFADLTSTLSRPFFFGSATDRSGEPYFALHS